MRATLTKIAVTILCIVGGLLLGWIVLVIAGKDASAGYEKFFEHSIGSFDTISDGLKKNGAILILTGLAVAVALRAGLFNIGVNGQLIIGAIVSAYFGYKLNLPHFLQIVFLILISGVSGGIYAAIAGILKVWRGVHEVISTIMMNWVAFFIVEGWVVAQVFTDPKTRYTTGETPTIKEVSQVGDLIKGWFKTENDAGFSLGWTLMIAIFFAFLIFIIMGYTRRGYEIKAVGLNKESARCAGINVNMRIIEAMFISGFLGGVAGALLIVGVLNKYPAIAHFTQGFDGIAVALISWNHPIGIIFIGSLFGILSVGSGGFQFAEIPKSFYDLIFSIIMLTLSIQNVSRVWLEKLLDVFVREKTVNGKESG